MEQDKIWDYYQNVAKDGFSSNTGRLDYITTLIKRGESVLTIGAGDLYLEAMLVAKGVHLSVLDPSANTINAARADLELSHANAKVGYSQNIPYNDGSFDVVIMSEVLEHLDNDVLRDTVTEVFRVLKNRGRFIGTVPYRENLKNSELMCPNCGNVFHKVGHLQSFTEQRLRSVLGQKFDNNQIRIWVRFLPSWRILNLRGRIVGVMTKLLEVFGIYSGKSNIIFVSKK